MSKPAPHVSHLAALQRHQVPVVLGLLLTVHTTITALLLTINNPLVHAITDDFAHVAAVYHLWTSLEIGGLGAVPLFLRELNSHYVYLPYFPLTLAAMLWEPAAYVARLANVFYFAILLVSVYHIGKACHSRGAGLMSATLVSLMPATYGGWRTIGLDFPALCVTPAAVLFLLRSERFSRPREVLLFGVTAGLAILTKVQVAFFLVPVAATVLLQALVPAIRARRFPRRELLLAGLSVVLVLGVTAVWWVGRLPIIIEEFVVHTDTEGMLFVEGDVSFWGGVVFYTTRMPWIITGLLTLALLPLAPRFFGHARHRVALATWVLAPLLLHVILTLRNIRYVFPLVPALAVILGVGLFSLPHRWRRVAAPALVLGAVGLWLICPFSGAQCHKTRVQALEPYHGLALSPKSSPASFLLVCGQAEYVTPMCPPIMGGPADLQGAQAARWIARHSDRRRKLLVTYAVDTSGVATAMQRRLPRARLTSFNWMPGSQLRPPASWQRFAILQFPTQQLGRLRKASRHAGRKLLLLVDPEADPKGAPDRPRFVVLGLRPNDDWPRYLPDAGGTPEELLELDHRAAPLP